MFGIMTVVTLVLSLAVVTFSAEILVRGASVLALRAGVTPLFVGLTVVGFGTSMPELGASLAATARGATDVSVGNVVGSNIFNICVVLGVSALFRPIRVRLAAIRRDLAVALAAATVPWLSVLSGATLPRWFGLLMLGALLGYVGFAYRAGRRAASEERQIAAAGLQSTLDVPQGERRLRDRVATNVLLVIAGLGLLVVGSRVFVDAALDIARSFGVSELAIGLTIVAVGTSLPELVTSLVAAARGNPDIAVGNIVGSNIFNVLGILGVSAVVLPQTMSPWILSIDTPVMLTATAALLPIVRSGGRISRAEGAALVVGYVAYVGYALARGG
jgi:cation:H+ antiporter